VGGLGSVRFQVADLQKGSHEGNLLLV
jgi:hypothetical protein